MTDLTKKPGKPKIENQTPEIKQELPDDATTGEAGDVEIQTTIVDKVRVGATPAVPAVGAKRDAGELWTIKANPVDEYVANGRLSWYTNMVQTLSHAIDELTGDLGATLYEKMALDPQIASCLTVLKAGILGDGIDISAADLPDDLNDAHNQDLAKQIADFCKRVVGALETPLEEVLWDMLDAIHLGNKVAELVWIMAYGDPSGPKIEIRRIHVKPRDSVAFAVDMYMNVVGILGRTPNAASPIQPGTILHGDVRADSLIPREKFAVLTYRPRNGDPRGTSVLRVAYNSWWIKQQLYPEWLKFLAQFATPSLVGYTAPDSQAQIQTNSDGSPKIDPDTGAPIQVSPETLMAETLVKVKNGSVVVFKAGAKVEALSMAGAAQQGGSAFLAAFDKLDYWLTKAILSQTLATEEGEHQARAAASVHQDILGIIIKFGKDAICRMIAQDILKPLVKYNFGEDALVFLPKCTMAKAEQQDFASLANAIGTLFKSGYLDPSQLQETDIMLGLTPRAREIIEQMIQAKALGQQMLKKAAAGDPASEEDEDGDEKGGIPAKGPPGSAKAPPVSSKLPAPIGAIPAA